MGIARAFHHTLSGAAEMFTPFPSNEPRFQRPRALDIAALFAIAALVLLPALGAGVVWLNAEERVWEVTETMLRTGDYLVPQLEGRPHFTKPPLVYWMGAATGRLLGRDDVLIVRLPSALCAIAAVVLTYLLGCAVRSRRVGFLAALLLLSTELFIAHGRMGAFDMPLTAAVALALYGAWLWLETRARPAVAAALVFAGCALGFMIKGPVAWAIVALALLGPLAVRGQWRRLLAWPVAPFLLLLFACSGAWFALVIARDPQARNVFYEQIALRFGDDPGKSTAEHFEPIYQYLLWLPEQLAPWIVYLPVVAMRLARHWPVPRSSPLWFLVIWFAANFVFFSLVRSKQEAYLLPLYPAAAVLAAWMLFEALEGRERERAWLRFTNLALGLACLPAAIVLALLFWVRAGTPVAICVAIGLLTAAIGAMVSWLAWRRDVRRATFCLLAGWLLLCPVIQGYFMPAHRFIHINRKSPERAASQQREDALRVFFGLPPEKPRPAD